MKVSNTLKSRSRNLKSQNVSGSQRKTLISPSRKVSHLPFATPLLTSFTLEDMAVTNDLFAFRPPDRYLGDKEALVYHPEITHAYKHKNLQSNLNCKVENLWVMLRTALFSIWPKKRIKRTQIITETDNFAIWKKYSVMIADNCSNKYNGMYYKQVLDVWKTTTQ